jgi:hypothetical protein
MLTTAFKAGITATDTTDLTLLVDETRVDV